MKRALEKLSNLDDLIFLQDSTQNLNAGASPTKIPINQIKRTAQQPRRYFDEDKLESLAKSISDVGLLEPIVVREVDAQAYELIAGERRLRACQKLGHEFIAVNIIECDEEKARHIRLIENLQREDLNAYEEAISSLDLLALLLSIDVEDVVKLLYSLHHAYKGDTTSVTAQNMLGSDELKVIEEFFNKLGRLSWQSFVATRLPLLNLKDDIKLLLLEGKLEFSKALVISRVKDDTARATIAKQAIDNKKLSVAKIKELVNSANAGGAPVFLKEITIPVPKEVSRRLNKVSRRLKDNPIWDKPQEVNQLIKYLAQIEKLLG